MVGTTKEEALIFLVDLKDMFNDELVQATMDGVFGAAGKSGAEALALYSSNRPGAAAHELVAAVETDRMFTIPAIRLADAQVQHNPDLWMYRFDWRTPARDGAFGAHHFLEVPFAFDQIDNPQAAGFLGDARPHELAAATHSAWVAFVKDGDPNNAVLAGVAALRRRTRDRRCCSIEPCRVETKPSADEVELWSGVL